MNIVTSKIILVLKGVMYGNVWWMGSNVKNLHVRFLKLKSIQATECRRLPYLPLLMHYTNNT